MFKIKLADIVFAIENKYPYVERQCGDYITDESPDCVISMTDEMIEAERAETFDFDEGYLESIAVYRQISEALLTYDGFLMHSAVISVHGKVGENIGIAFGARSGTGKTTHIRLWKKLLGDECKIINGDKPLIRFFDGVPYAYGTPWSGKECYNINTRVRLRELCCLSRSAENYIKPSESRSAVMFFMHQIYFPTAPALRIRTMELADKLFKSVGVWDIGCNMDISAAETAYKGLMGDDYK